ncbi:hypothetical protein M011DRAFT_462434 [Sporormia fimetaria CBS 119925]|uniref:Uncharacterized protein n=1 Tax=Sporormia fimetaria CBS 119925 TaxID=1340428 RepID=A0A6A6UYF6_9PLEO|nr:hypothetical protein M011DRAFT_462434 [Sporormia fimetaria CBS 119925]
MREATSSATINFADFPDYDPDANASPILRIPMQTQFAEAESRAVPEAEEEILPTIFTVSDPSTHIHPPSAMQDVADNSAIDFQGLASKVGETVGRTKRVLQGVVDEALATKARN